MKHIDFREENLNCFCCGKQFIYDPFYTYHVSEEEAESLGIAEYDPICDECVDKYIFKGEYHDFR